MNNIFNKIKGTAAAVVMTALAATAALCGCDRKFEMDLPLAVTSRALSLKADAGSTHVLVYSDGEWTARFTNDVKWASINKKLGYGNTDIVFTYAANYGVSRKVGLIFQKGELCDTVVFSQAGTITEPSITFDKAAISLLRSGSQISLPISTNFRYSFDDVQASVVYYDSEGLANEPVLLTKAEDEEVEGDTPEEPKAQPVDPWIGIVSCKYNKLVLEIGENESQLPRTADLSLFIENADGEITKASVKLTQGISDPEFSLEESEGTYAGYAQACLIPAVKNNIAPYSNSVDFKIEGMSEEDEWIRDLRISDDGLEFEISENSGDGVRTADILISYTDALGNNVSASYKISQRLYPKLISFEALRNLPAGEISSAQYIEGWIVSEPTSVNIVSSPQTKQFGYDREENKVTAYIESLDGKYGFCLKFASAEDNVTTRFSKTRIAIDGLTLERHDNPEYYTIKGLTAENIIAAEEPSEIDVPAKRMTIRQLTDNDIFTMVSLQNVEILAKDGSYTNASDGYTLKDAVNPVVGTATAPRWDVAPLMMYDNDGGNISMLTNAECSWRRYTDYTMSNVGKKSGHNTIVPQGSGTFRGIVVSDPQIKVRYGDVGRYQVRAMTVDDISLNGAPFANTIVEWNWDDLTADTTPEIGKGVFNINGATGAANSDFNDVAVNNTATTSSAQKGLIPNSAYKLEKKWWNFETNTGEWIEFKFSTEGISGSQLMFGIIWGCGQMNNTSIFVPCNWNLLYSVDGGENFTKLEDGYYEYVKCRCISWWTTTANDTPTGFTEHLRYLPSECFGKSEVIVRLQVANTVTNIVPATSASTYLTNLACEQGTLASSKTAANQALRIGTVTVRYY